MATPPMSGEVRHQVKRVGAGPRGTNKGSRATSFPFWPAAYGFLAMMTALLVKLLIVRHGFREFSILVAFQSVVSAGLIMSAQTTDLTRFRQQLPTSLLLMALPTVFALLNAGLGFAAQVRVNVPMMLVLRRTTTGFTLVAELLVMGKKVEAPVVLAVLIVMTGTVIAGCRDMTFDAFGYFVVFVQNCVTTAQAVSLNMVSKKLGLDGFAVSLLTGTLSFPLLLLWSLVLTDDLRMVVDGASSYPLQQWGLILMVVLLGGANAIASVQSSTRHSPLTTSVAGNTKDLLQTLVGAWFFHDYVFDEWNVVGICISFVGCGGYALAKHRAAIRSNAAAEEKKDE